MPDGFALYEVGYYEDDENGFPYWVKVDGFEYKQDAFDYARRLCREIRYSVFVFYRMGRYGGVNMWYFDHSERVYGKPLTIKVHSRFK